METKFSHHDPEEKTKLACADMQETARKNGFFIAEDFVRKYGEHTVKSAIGHLTWADTLYMVNEDKEKHESTIYSFLWVRSSHEERNRRNVTRKADTKQTNIDAGCNTKILC